MTDTKTFLWQPLLRLVAICALPLVVAPLFEYLAVAPYGSSIFLWLKLLILLPFLIGLLALLIAPFFLFSRRLRPFAVRALIAATILFVSSTIGLRLGGHVRMAAFHRLAERSKPLVQAVRAYESRHGAPPLDLPALVPEFLPEVPGTGMAAYPDYGYYVGERATHHDGNPWVLFVPTPSGSINFDQFMYLPRQNYPKSGYGGSLERIADWAYVHE